MMQSVHDMSALFAQFGRASDPAAISTFLASPPPLLGAVRLHEAVFWTPSEAEFLRPSVIDAADWADVVEQQNADLHQAR